MKFIWTFQKSISVLDESTNQISPESEEIIYSMCKELGITVLSVGHRQSLTKYHQMLLHIEGDGNWTMKPLINSSWLFYKVITNSKSSL